MLGVLQFRDERDTAARVDQIDSALHTKPALANYITCLTQFQSYAGCDAACEGSLKLHELQRPSGLSHAPRGPWGRRVTGPLGLWVNEMPLLGQS